MTDTIRELIMKNRATTLAGITVALGFDNTIASVQRSLPDGNTLALIPCIWMDGDADEKKIKTTNPYIYKEMTVVLSVLTRVDTASDARPGDEVLNAIHGDIERAWLSDRTCGGNAIFTEYHSSGKIEPAEGQPEIGRWVAFTVQYKHFETDPKTK